MNNTQFKKNTFSNLKTKHAMHYHFEILEKKDLEKIVPLVYDLNKQSIEKTVLTERFKDMKNCNNYECAVIIKNNTIIGVSGLWYCTRHYSGRSVELDHVYLKPEYRSQGIGKTFINWLYQYCKAKGYETIELNTYVQNHASHKFYFNEGFIIKGYHFIKPL